MFLVREKLVLRAECLPCVALAPNPIMLLPILHEDNHILAINKPAGLLSQGDRTGDDSVVTLAKAYLKEAYAKPGNVYLGLVHRLDRPASGAMVLARTSKAACRLSASFAQRAVRKRYIAVVEGRLEGHGRWEDRLRKVKGAAQVVAGGSPGGRAASLSWRVLGYTRGCTLVQVDLHTGRIHQIRCQFAHRGYPLLGDLRYGARRTFDGRNLALHSYRLVVPHPVKRRPVSFTALPSSAWKPWAFCLPDDL